MSGRVSCVLVAFCLLVSSAVANASERQLHQLRWFVHEAMIDEAGGRDLAFYQQIIDEAVVHASEMMQGLQGPVDSACCVELTAPSVEIFSGAGLDVPSSAADWTALRNLCGAGSCAFLTESLLHCWGPTASAVGCADTPFCTGDPNDDPLLILVVTMDAYEFGSLGDTLAHERGHNACLGHVGGDTCQVMQSSGGGGCISGAECQAMADGRNASGGVCGCHVDEITTLADGMSCVDDAGSGLCSGGRCGHPQSSAGLHLLASGDAVGATTDEAMMLSGLTGGWQQMGAIGESMVPRGPHGRRQ